MKHLQRRHAYTHLHFVAALYCLLIATPLTAAELTEDQIEMDPHFEAQTDKTGAYRIEVNAVPLELFFAFNHREGTLTDVEGAKEQLKKTKWLRPDAKDGKEHFSFEVLAPKDYSRDRPPGILVCINAWDTGNYANQLHEAADKANLIVIGANDSGNKHPYPERMMLATHAVDLIKRRYAIDEERIYITGYSGGAGVSNTLVYYRPDLFKGTVLMCGAAMLTPGSKYGTLLKSQPSRNQMRTLTQETRFYVITGTKDSALDICKASFENWKSNGFQHTHIEIVEGLPHKLPQIKPEQVAAGFAFLDAPLVKQAMRTFEDAQQDLKRNRLEDALAGFQVAATRLMLNDKPEIQAAMQEAQQQVAALTTQYDEAVAKLEQAIADKDAETATEVLRDLQQGWRDKLGRDAANGYRKKILDIKRGS